MTPYLCSRVSVAMNRANPTPSERQRVIDALQGVRSFEDLPPTIQRTIRRWEKGA